MVLLEKFATQMLVPSKVTPFGWVPTPGVTPVWLAAYQCLAPICAGVSPMPLPEAPAGPVGPTAPAVPVGPAAPLVPAVPWGPVGPTAPAEPAAPAVPWGPVG